MFLGMTMVGPMSAMHRAFRSWRGRENQALTSGASVGKVFVMVMGPAVCDLVATIFQNVGLVLTSVSIWQMLRGSIAVFSAIQRYLYMGEAPKRYESVGIALVTMGLCVVGYASVLMPDDGSSSGSSNALLSIIGIVCVLIAQFVQAWQTVLEEKLLHNVEVEPNFIVFLEGFWGLLFTTVVFMPLAQLIPGEDNGMGIHENVWPEEPYMLGHSALLVSVAIVYICVILTYNVTGMFVCDHTEATTRNVIDAARALCVWVCALLINAISPGAPGGESLGIWSFFELAGFILLVLGLFVYYGVIFKDRLMGTDARTPALTTSLQEVSA